MAKKETEQTKEVGKTTSEEQALADMARNLRFYAKGCAVPQDALKEIRAGRLKGKSDVNPMWRMKRLTEIFGPCGFGWRYTVDKQWTEQYGDEVKCFCNVSLYVRDPETKEWSEAIPGNGGSSLVSVERDGKYVNDEGYKMALTDALSIAMKPLGIGANIWYGPKAKGHNESKYEEYTQNQQAQAPAYTGQQLKEAVDELSKVKSREEYERVWKKWGTTVPAICAQGTEFYKLACILAKQIA